MINYEKKAINFTKLCNCYTFIINHIIHNILHKLQNFFIQTIPHIM